MHEMSITQSLIAIVEEEMVKNNAERLRSVKVNIGEMSGIVPGALKTCFDILIENTKMEGAILNMKMVPLKGRCRKCSNEFDINEYRFLCPECESADIDVVSGREMNIVEIEVD